MTMKIMLVDDDPVIRVLLTDYLQALHYDVETVDSGIKCLESLAKRLPDALLLDFQMPVMNGLEVLKNIRKNSIMQDLPVIMLSANNDTEKVIKAANLQADAYIVKPFEMSQIQATLQKVCGRQ